MASVKLKFRPSADSGKEGTLVFQLIHGRVVRRIASGYKIFSSEWDEAGGRIVLPLAMSARHGQIELVRFNVEWELQRLRKAVGLLERTRRRWTIDEAVRRAFPCVDAGHSVFGFISAQASRKRQLGKIRSSETYRSALNSFMRFRQGIDLTFDMIDSDLMELYEAELRGRGVSRNTSSFYLRILRTNYKLAVEKGLTQDHCPFKHVYCGIDKTVKRSLPFSGIKKIKELDLAQSPKLAFARDMFIFSFCTRGMSFVDMAFLKKKTFGTATLPTAGRRPGSCSPLNGQGRCRTFSTGAGKATPSICCPSSAMRMATSAANTRTR